MNSLAVAGSLSRNALTGGAELGDVAASLLDVWHFLLECELAPSDGGLFL